MSDWREIPPTGPRDGYDSVAVIIHGKLISDTVAEAGIVVQPKVRPQTEAVAA